mmetsp:Transcript_22800/g.71563  ORF Transcript_22800/g.71563 Transcript_22800/m.71563 type:complete len:233 (-) Transcript_22800:687-1385(-)
MACNAVGPYQPLPAPIVTQNHSSRRLFQLVSPRIQNCHSHLRFTPPVHTSSPSMASPPACASYSSSSSSSSSASPSRWPRPSRRWPLDGERLRRGDRIGDASAEAAEAGFQRAARPLASPSPPGGARLTSAGRGGSTGGGAAGGMGGCVGGTGVAAEMAQEASRRSVGGGGRVSRRRENEILSAGEASERRSRRYPCSCCMAAWAWTGKSNSTKQRRRCPDLLSLGKMRMEA